MRSINFSRTFIVKETSAIIFVFFFLSTLIISCKKGNLETEEPKPPSYENLIPKIKSWIDERKINLPAASVARIESLESNLSYGEIRLERYKASKELVVIPILSGFKSANNSDKSPANYLVIVMESRDSITNGNIVQYVSSSSQKTPPNNTFYKIFTYQNIDCSGQFTMLNLRDDFQYELKFEEGKLHSLADRGRKKHPNEGSTARINDDCIDWYLQIWYVWSDGSMTLQSETYVYTTCDGDCAQPRMANGRSYRTNCNGGGAGGGGYNVEYEYPVSREWKWGITYTSNWYAESYETVSGVKKAGEPQGGHFTGIVHVSSYFTVTAGYTWEELGNTVSKDTEQKVYSSTTGKAIAPGGGFSVYSRATDNRFDILFP